MSKELIDERGLEAAAAFALEAQARGDRFLKEIGVEQIVRAYLSGIPEKPKDVHLANMIQQVRSYLQANNPVMAYGWINDINRHLEEQGVI